MSTKISDRATIAAAEAHRLAASTAMPKLVSSSPSYQRRSAIQSVLPKGASLMPEVRANSYDPFGGTLSNGGGASGGDTLFHMQRPYFPEIESPERQWYPRDRKRANQIWRMFHKFDPIFGNAVEMYADMLVSSFEIEIPQDAGADIKDTLEYMCDRCKIVEVLKQLVIEYLVIGEAMPHTFFSEDLGIWTYVGFHNPDFIDVKDAPLINMDPLLTFEPDERLRTLLSEPSVDAREIQKKFPQEFVNKVLARQPIRLASTNASFVARKLHPYDERGTSLASRLWRIFLVEDAVYNATIATFRRAASPIKVAKLGSESQGWLPSPEAEARFMDLVAKAEQDPQAWLVWNYGISFEQWGDPSRAISIGREHDVIEKVKLLALGLSKTFLSGESSYASAKSGLQVFLRRLLSLRQYIENVWLMPKFFRPISEMNDWTYSRGSQVERSTGGSGYRISKTGAAIDDHTRYIMPKIHWKNKLDPEVDSDLLAAYGQLEKTFGIKLSKSTVMAAVGLDLQTNEEKALKEFKDSEALKTKVLGPALVQKYDTDTGGAGGAKPPGGAGSGAKPPGAGGKTPSKDDASNPPGSGAGGEGSGALAEPIEAPGEDIPSV